MAVERAETGQSALGERSQRWHFARCILDGRTHQLFVNDVETELERKPLEVLVYLLQHAGEVCTKDELLATVWPGRVLSETVLTKCIGRLRELLGDSAQEVIKTAYGFGYRLAVPVRVESAAAPATPHFDFRPGEHPPGRPLWSLIERLGSGAHGEAWRGRHEKTREQRVFKLALDESSLGALKREITLFRVINDTLGPDAPVAKLLDWNLEQPPYFIETDYAAGGSLSDWAQSRGGLTVIPLEDRLEIVARIAAALAAVHSVGVLHKDLKPSNVLVKPAAADPFQILLADFGSGGVLDAKYFERLGITRLGFTKTVAVPESGSATPMYLAPEVLAGQPFTVKSDIYALGVILFQMVVGDFNKLMSPGWERNVEDELLRQDIASFADGNPAVRPADADLLARQLRSLAQRRAQLNAERDAQAKADKAKRLLERAQARRAGLIAAFTALVVGLITSTVLYLQAREAHRQSDLAAARSKSVTEFLSNDVFAPVSSGTEPVKNLRVTELLTRAGDKIDRRFAKQPEVAAELHYVIARSLNEFYESGIAVSHFTRAIELSRQTNGPGAELAVRATAESIYLDYALGALRKTIAGHESTLAAGRARLTSHNDALLTLRQNLAQGEYLLGNWQLAEQQLQQLLLDEPALPKGKSAFEAHTHLYLGQVLTVLHRNEDAETQLRTAINQLSATLGEQHPDVAEARAALGRALTNAGHYDEARFQIDTAEELAKKWAPLTTWTVMRPRVYKGLLLLDTHHPLEARELFAEIVEFQDAHANVHPELDHTGWVRQALAETYLLTAQPAKAVEILQRAVQISTRADGFDHPMTQSIRLSLAEALLASGEAGPATQSLEGPPSIVLTMLPPAHPFHADSARIRGLLARVSGNTQQARTWLQSAASMYESLYGPQNWRTVRARRELDSATH